LGLIIHWIFQNCCLKRSVKPCYKRCKLQSLQKTHLLIKMQVISKMKSYRVLITFFKIRMATMNPFQFNIKILSLYCIRKTFTHFILFMLLLHWFLFLLISTDLSTSISHLYFILFIRHWLTNKLKCSVVIYWRPLYPFDIHDLWNG
jgi:hypothetical protein